MAQAERLSAAFKAKPYLKPLHDRLLELGGSVTVLWNDDLLSTDYFVRYCLHHARASDGKSTRQYRRGMLPCRCYENSVRLAYRYPKRYQRAIGYALSVDGLWRPHSWALDVKRKQIVETTEKRLIYFGVVIPLTRREIEKAAAQVKLF